MLWAEPLTGSALFLLPQEAQSVPPFAGLGRVQDAGCSPRLDRLLPGRFPHRFATLSVDQEGPWMIPSRVFVFYVFCNST